MPGMLKEESETLGPQKDSAHASDCSMRDGLCTQGTCARVHVVESFVLAQYDEPIEQIIL